MIVSYEEFQTFTKYLLNEYKNLSSKTDNHEQKFLPCYELLRWLNSETGILSSL